MALQEIEQKALNYISSKTEKTPVDFYRKISDFTKNLSSEQLLLLRDHLNRLSSEQSRALSKNATNKLSKRETEVLILLTNGYNRRNIGHSLGISANTAARHIANIYQKLGITCVAEATHYALSQRIIS